MINADKYLKDGVDINKMIDDYRKTGQKCPTVWKWLKKEVKPTLLEDEKVILRNALKSGIDAIFRSDTGIYFHSNKTISGIFNHLFQFMNPRRRI